MTTYTSARTHTMPNYFDSTLPPTNQSANGLGNGTLDGSQVWRAPTSAHNTKDARGFDATQHKPNPIQVAEPHGNLRDLIEDSIPSVGPWATTGRGDPRPNLATYNSSAPYGNTQRQYSHTTVPPPPPSLNTAPRPGSFKFPPPMSVYTSFNHHPRPDGSTSGSTISPISPTNTRAGLLTAQPTSRTVSQPPSRHSNTEPSYMRPAAFGFASNTQRVDSVALPVQNRPLHGSQGNEHLSSHLGSSSLGSQLGGASSANPRKPSEQYNRFSQDGSHSQHSSRPSTAHKSKQDEFDYDFRIHETRQDQLDLADLDALISTGAQSRYPPSNTLRNQTMTSSIRERDAYDVEEVSPSSLGSKFVPRVQYDWSNGYDSTLSKTSPGALDLASMSDAQYSQILGLRNPYASAYANPYALPGSMQYGAGLPYYPMFSMGLSGLDGALIAHPDLPITEGVQSKKLYEFKLAGKSNKRYELKDIFDNIAEFAGDQHGSRFIQTKLETANSDEKERVFREIEPNAIPLMTDVFGNYVIQKFFDHGHQDHKRMLANKMRGQVLNLSTQMYGCRVVQKALEHVLIEQQTALVSELEHHVLECVKNKDGNHVIQKAIERCPPDTISFIYQAFVGQVHYLSLHAFGCRVIQRCLERQDWFPAKARIMAELHESMGQGIVANDYGNYVVQHVVEKGTQMDRKHVFSIVIQGLESYSKHKFASNVVEKCIEYSDDNWRREVIGVLVAHDQRRGEGDSVLAGLIKDNYGNYVVQKLLEKLCPADFIYFHQHLQPAINHAKRSGCGKQLISIEKKMQDRLPYLHSNSRPHHPMMLGVPSHPHTPYGSHYGSAANTPPPLTADTQSLQSSGLPSVNGDTVEGAHAHGMGMMRKGSEGMHGMR